MILAATVFTSKNNINIFIKIDYFPCNKYISMVVLSMKNNILLYSNLNFSLKGATMSFYEELKAKNEQKVNCYHFCNATQKYEFLMVVTRKNIDRLMPINRSYAQFVTMNNGSMIEKYRFTELNDSTIPQI